MTEEEITPKDLFAASHTGTIHIKGTTVACAVLLEGSRIIESNIVTDGIVKDRELIREYYDRDGSPRKGYDADLFTDLLKQDYTLLIDQATGYQYENEIRFLPAILRVHLEPAGQWIEKIPVEFYQQLFKLQGLYFSMDNIIEKELWLGRWTYQYVLNKLPKETLFTLARNHPENITPPVQSAVAELENQARLVIERMKQASGWKDFIKTFKQDFGPVDGARPHVPMTEEEREVFMSSGIGPYLQALFRESEKKRGK